MNPQTASRLEKLYPALRNWASFLANNTEGLVTPDDLLQGMTLRLAERLTREPHRLEHSDEYLINDAVYSLSRTLIRSEVRAAAHIADVEVAEDIDEDEQSTLIVISDDNLTPEEHAIRLENYNRILDLFALMSPQNRQVAGLLSAGYRESEIAAEMGMSRSSVSLRKKTIAGLLSRLGI